NVNLLPVGLDPRGTMLANHVAAAIDGARPSQLDEIARTLWKAHAAGLVTAEEAQELAEAIEARRALGKASQSVQKPEQRRVGSRPRSAASLERRRRWVAAGMLPPGVAALFTAGESAVLSVIAIEVQRRGRCELFLAAIAATAGVSVSTVKNAMREARRLGLIEVRERRMSWTRNASNVVTIVAPEWKTWLRMGARRSGDKTLPSTPTSSYQKRFAPFENASKTVGNRFGGPLARSERGTGRKYAPG
ncbi:hypothetical protein, partial [Aureimonas endophytica]|uniref:hypothetical protein n=1 Tax=Aureimonas endophytica TaxID=2027858 RepID=UPI001667E705